MNKEEEIRVNGKPLSERDDSKVTIFDNLLLAVAIFATVSIIVFADFAFEASDPDFFELMKRIFETGVTIVFFAFFGPLVYFVFRRNNYPRNKNVKRYLTITVIMFAAFIILLIILGVFCFKPADI